MTRPGWVEAGTDSVEHGTVSVPTTRREEGTCASRSGATSPAPGATWARPASRRRSPPSRTATRSRWSTAPSSSTRARAKGDVRPSLDMLTKKYGRTSEAQAAGRRGATSRAQARAEGLDYRTEGRDHGNTFDMHRLLHFAKDQGRQERAARPPTGPTSPRSGPSSTPSDWSSWPSRPGWTRTRSARSSPTPAAYADEVRADEREAAELGANGVPFFVLDRTYGVSGAQPAEVFDAGAQQAWGDRRREARCEPAATRRRSRARAQPRRRCARSAADHKQYLGKACETSRNGLGVRRGAEWTHGDLRRSRPGRVRPEEHLSQHRQLRGAAAPAPSPPYGGLRRGGRGRRPAAATSTVWRPRGRPSPGSSGSGADRVAAGALGRRLQRPDRGLAARRAPKS